jgi:hypothetical protein
VDDQDRCKARKPCRIESITEILRLQDLEEQSKKRD